jgi:hypothetical protein
MIIEIEHHAASAVSLFIAIIIYVLIAGYLYYDIWVNVDRKEDLKRWLEERKVIHEKRETERRSRISKNDSSSNILVA